MTKKQTARKRNNANLSVVPVTSRERTGTTPRHVNVRAALKWELKKETRRAKKSAERCKRLNAAITALGSLKEGD